MKVLFNVFLFCFLGQFLFAQTEYEAVIFDRSVLMGDSVRNVRRDVPYLIPGSFNSMFEDRIDGMQRLVFYEETLLSRIESRITDINADFYLNRLYMLVITITNVGLPHIQDEIAALKSIYGRETNSSLGKVIWHYKVPSNDVSVFSVGLTYTQGRYDYTLVSCYYTKSG